jgi:hypothetical protein
MDSGNSGSLQSSSGGDDEFDSRAGGGGGGGGADSSPLSALLRPSPSPSAAAFSLHGSYFGGLQEFTSAPPPPQQQQQQAGAWSGSFAGASGLPSSSSPRVAHADAGARPQGADASVAAAQAGQGGGMGAPAPVQQPPRGSRKRTRASRRAPTTVLTTDTSNFRAMVQEFTGIPSPPFGAGVGVGGLGGPTASLRTRFDHIFPAPSSLRSGGGTGADAAASLPPYLLRPFPHKLPSPAPSAFPPFTSSSSSTPSSSTVGTTNANAATGAGTATAASSSNPAAPTAAGDAFQQLTSSALLRLQQDASSYLSFQNLLDSQPSSQSIFGAAGGFAQPSSRMHDPTPSDFLAGGVGSSSLGHHGGLLGSEGLHLHHSRSDVHGHGHGHGGDELSGVVAAGGSCKLNYSSHAGAAGSSSSAAASAEKAPDGAGPGRPGRGGDAGLDPWICTSE